MTDLEMMEIIHKTDGVTYSMALEIVEELKKASAAAPQVVADERAHEIMNSMAVHVDDWADGLDYEPSKTEVSGKALHYILSRVAAPVQPVAVPDSKYGRLTGDNVAQPVQMKGEAK